MHTRAASQVTEQGNIFKETHTKTGTGNICQYEQHKMHLLHRNMKAGPTSFGSCLCWTLWLVHGPCRHQREKPPRAVLLWDGSEMTTGGVTVGKQQPAGGNQSRMGPALSQKLSLWVTMRGWTRQSRRLLGSRPHYGVNQRGRETRVHLRPRNPAYWLILQYGSSYNCELAYPVGQGAAEGWRPPSAGERCH